ncbi:MAG: type II toxin-antitoxin system prevent-host-death family antitoxin [Nitrospirota bacterium]|nr:type II toxin-antitoxin system prevent-host-death family antitoxin [Nitrospirota bacterium]
MIKSGIKEARQHFTEYLSRVEKGEEIVITKRDQPIARIIPVKKKTARALASRKDLRNAITPKGKPLSETVIASRREERY